MYRDSETLKAIFSLTETFSNDASTAEALEKWHEDLEAMPVYRLACLVHQLQNYLLTKIEKELVASK